MGEIPVLPRLGSQSFDAAAGEDEHKDQHEGKDDGKPSFAVDAFMNGCTKVIVIDLLGCEGMVAGVAGLKVGIWYGGNARSLCYGR